MHAVQTDAPHHVMRLQQSKQSSKRSAHEEHLMEEMVHTDLPLATCARGRCYEHGSQQPSKGLSHGLQQPMGALKISCPHCLSVVYTMRMLLDLLNLIAQ
jgi:hypothetical protein